MEHSSPYSLASVVLSTTSGNRTGKMWGVLRLRNPVPEWVSSDEPVSVRSTITKLELRVVLFRGKIEYTELIFYEMSYEKY